MPAVTNSFLIRTTAYSTGSHTSGVHEPWKRCYLGEPCGTHWMVHYGQGMHCMSLRSPSQQWTTCGTHQLEDPKHV
jgi:hypothetical protein